MTEKDVFEWLTEVEHPAREDRNIVELGIADEVVVDGNRVTVTLAFPKRPDPLKQYLTGESFPAEEMPDGWTLVCADGFPVGFADPGVNGMLKNRRNPGWRI